MKRKLIIAMLLSLSLLVGCGTNSSEINDEATAEVEIEEEVIEVASENVEDASNDDESSTTEEASEEEATEEDESDDASTSDSQQYTFTGMTATMYASNSVNLRDIPEKTGNKVGNLNKGEEVSVTGKCNETGWYRIDKDGSTVYVSDSYLQDEKPTEDTVSTQSSTASSSSKGTDVYTTPYMTNSGGTWYATADGMRAKYKSNTDGWVSGDAYTVEGLKAAYPDIGQVIDRGDGTIAIRVCGCCSSVMSLYGIPSFHEGAELANAAGYNGNDVITTGVEEVEWVGYEPDTWPHNFSFYIYGK